VKDAKDDYEIFEALGQGGMAVVHRARQKALDREVALKFIRADSIPTRDMAERFRREALTMGKLSHPNLVRVFDAGLLNQRPFIAMELVRGPSLQTLIEDEPDATRARADDLFAKVLAGVAALHKDGIIHRDLKPSNVMIDEDRGVVLDLGLLKHTKHDSTCLTAGGAVVGTLNYMAPEVVSSQPYSFACDVWALGCLYYHMHAGHPPFRGRNVTELVDVILKAELPRIAAECPGLSPMRRALLERLLDRDPARRPPDAMRALAEFQGRARGTSGPVPMRIVSAPSAATRSRRGTALVLGLASAALCALFVEMRPAPPRDAPSPVAAVPVVETPAPNQPLAPDAVRSRLLALEAAKLHDALVKDVEALPRKARERVDGAARLATAWRERLAAELARHGIPDLIDRARRAGVDGARDASEAVALMRAVKDVKVLLMQARDLGVRLPIDLTPLEPASHRCGSEPGPGREMVTLLFGADHDMDALLVGPQTHVKATRYRSLHLWSKTGGSFWATDITDVGPQAEYTVYEEKQRLPLRAPRADERLVISLRVKSLMISEHLELSFSADGQRFDPPVAWFIPEEEESKYTVFHHRIHPGVITGPRWVRLSYVHRNAVSLKGSISVRGILFRYVPR
jgi:tRNA A-37 threonylcarbamoyl transferase component Bud32